MPSSRFAGLWVHAYCMGRPAALILVEKTGCHAVTDSAWQLQADWRPRMALNNSQQLQTGAGAHAAVTARC